MLADQLRHLEHVHRRLAAEHRLQLGVRLIMRLFFGSCRPFFLMYAHSFFVTSVRGIGLDPTIPASAGLGVTGFMNAAFGCLFFAFAALAMQAPLSLLAGPHPRSLLARPSTWLR